MKVLCIWLKLLLQPLRRLVLTPAMMVRAGRSSRKELLSLLVLVMRKCFRLRCVPVLEVPSRLLTMQAGLSFVLLSMRVMRSAAAAPLRALVIVTLAWKCTSLLSTLVCGIIGTCCVWVVSSLGPLIWTVVDMIRILVLVMRVVVRLWNMCMLVVVSCWAAVPLVRLEFDMVQLSAVSILVTLSTLMLFMLMKRMCEQVCTRLGQLVRWCRSTLGFLIVLGW